MNHAEIDPEVPYPDGSSEPEVATFRYAPHAAPRRPTNFRLPKGSWPSGRTVANVGAGFLIAVLLIGFLGTSNIPQLVSLRRKAGINLTVGTPNGGLAINQQVTIEESSAIITAAKSVSPAVVSITASQQVTSYYGQSSSQEVSSGSGFILTADGLIMTNKHVVSTAGATYKVVLDDGRVFDGTVQAVDPLNDLAIVKIKASNLPVVSFGSSDSLKIGQTVLAIGNALGEFQNSVTSGIVSAKGRSISPQSESGSGSEQLTDLIQVDAAINPGNSGGPLVNLAGQVVGIDTAIASTTGGSVGIGFAIPVDDFMPVITSVEKTGKISVPYLGVRYQQVDTTVQQLDNLPVNYGALVSGSLSQGPGGVISGGPADKAGIQANDIILSVDGVKIEATNTLQRLLQKHQPNDVVTLSINRSGKVSDVKVALGSQDSQ